MTDFLSRIKTRVAEKKKKSPLTQTELQSWGLTGIQLRSYQLDGVRWLTQCLHSQEGCILGDEMGLGKTCQTISLLLYVSAALGRTAPSLIVCPLSVMENWRTELERFAPALTVLCYYGDKEKRDELQRKAQDFNLLLTTFELCLKDNTFLKRWRWETLVVDEAHRLKNQKSLLHQTLAGFSVKFRVLLTGTPIQNNLSEIYSLLSFIQPSIFTAQETEHFVQSYSDVLRRPALAAELQSVLEPFLLRRVKSEVALDLPKKMELVMYHGLTLLQKELYRAALTRDMEAFGSKQGNKNRLQNTLMNLRKCINHPYLFNGVEPEPFQMGEHLVQASGKLCLLDKILSHLHKEHHRVLLFSLMTRMLDIIQDYLEYRGYSYERLDGSVRGEERNLAVKTFSTEDVFVFLLSTKAGGVGLNLTAADTVIFLDSDFNPQNDLQAAARCHRIGQNRPVKIIRLLARHTAEEIMYARAVSKLELTNTVIEDGRFALQDPAEAAAARLQLSEILKFGVDELLSTGESSVQEMEAEKLEKILGPTCEGEWVEEDGRGEEDEEEEEEEEERPGSSSQSDRQNHMYFFEGTDYRKMPSANDLTYFDDLAAEQSADVEKTLGEGRALRRKNGVLLPGRLRSPTRSRRPLSDAELQQRKQRREEAAAKRAKLQLEATRKLKEQKYKKKLAWWESCGYRSPCLPSVDSEGEEEEEEEEDEEEEEEDSLSINYVLGDVTRPHAADGDAIIIHCVDDSGRWGRGGLFTALELRSDEPRKQYELAGKMKDLELGNVLLFRIDDKQSRANGQDRLALIVSQQRDRSNVLSGILLTALDEGLKKISAAAKQLKASVHLPRIGHSTRGFNWYGTERLVRKHLSSRRVPTFIYYHSRAAKAPPRPLDAAAGTSSSPPPQLCDPDAEEETSGPSASAESPVSAAPLPSFMSGVNVFFYNLPASERKRLARYLITYDGDEADVMSSEVTHIVAEVESNFHSRDLQDLVREYAQVQPVHKAWLESCFSKQRRVDSARFTHTLP